MSGSGHGADGPPELTAFQLEVARLFFVLPESTGFLLAGGAALLAQRLTTRPTQDLDFFTAPVSPQRAMLCSRRPISGAGAPSGFMTATHSAG